MKRNSLATLGLLSAFLLQSSSAAVNVTGNLTYIQNFDTLPTGAARAEFDWTDDVTIPGFYLHRSNAPAGQTNLAGTLATAAARPFISNGSEIATTAPNFHGFLSLGNYNDTDRALGNCPTTDDSATNWAGGTLSIVGLFTNTGAKSVDLTGMTYDVENWRANNGNTNVETISLTYKLGAASALLAELATTSATAAFNQTGYQSVNAGSFDLISSDGFATPAPPGSNERSGTLTPAIRLAPGQSIALRWGNPNDGGTDAQVGIDNLIISFVEVNASVVPAVSAVVRDVNSTPANPNDDKINFTLTVSGLGSVNPAGWTISSPAALAGTTGTYGVAKDITGVDIGEFIGAGHTLDVVVEDQGNPGTNATAIVTTPWCSITPVVTGVNRVANDPGNLLDDTWGYTIRVNGQFTGAGWTSTNASYLSGNYGTDIVVSGLSINSPTDTATITDDADLACTAAVSVSAPLIIGNKNFGTLEPLASDSSGVPAAWVVSEAARTQRMNNGGGAPAKVYRSEVIDLSAIGVVKFSANLAVEDLSSGFEADDTFNAQLIIDGNTAAPVSLITPHDTLTPADNILTGAEISPATVGPPPTTGLGNWVHPLSAVIPASANSVQLVISGNNNSTNETMTVQDVLFELAAHSIDAFAGGVQFDNKGTVDPADDEFRQGVNITGISPPAGSTGWTSNLTPAAGLYTDANPVLFGPFLQSEPARDLTLTNNNVPTVTKTLSITPPTPSLVVTFVNGFRIANGAGPADDTATINVTISAPIGGPEFIVETYPARATASSNALTGTATPVTITIDALPDKGNVEIIFRDASYPGSEDVLVITVNDLAVTQYVVARKDLGAGLSDVVTLAGPVPAQWINYAGVPALEMTNSAAVSATVTSEVIDLSAVSGDVRFTGNFHAIDRTSGFEATDTFKAELLITSPAGTQTVNLITAYDTDANGVMNGGTLAAEDEFNAAKVQDGDFVSDFPLAYTIPNDATSVQLIITGINDSANETFIVEKCLFTVVTAGGDTDGDGVSDANEAIMGTDPGNPASVTRLSQNAASPGEFSFSGVDGRFYRIYKSDDAAAAGHLTAWTDTGIGFSGAGDHTVNVAVGAGVSRRFYRVHVMQADGQWPAAVP